MKSKRALFVAVTSMCCAGVALALPARVASASDGEPVLSPAVLAALGCSGQSPAHEVKVSRAVLQAVSHADPSVLAVLIGSSHGSPAPGDGASAVRIIGCGGIPAAATRKQSPAADTGKGSGKANGQGNGKGHGQSNGKGQAKGKGQGNSNGQGNGNSNGQGGGNGQANGNGNGQGNGNGNAGAPGQSRQGGGGQSSSAPGQQGGSSSSSQTAGSKGSGPSATTSPRSPSVSGSDRPKVAASSPAPGGAPATAAVPPTSLPSVASPGSPGPTSGRGPLGIRTIRWAGHQTPLAAVSGPWAGLSLKVARHLTVPILFGAAVALFLLLQALIDRRDPKVFRAPERDDDETIGFS